MTEKAGAWELVKRLNKLSEEDKLKWEKTIRDGMYQVSFPQYAVQLRSQHAEEPGALDYILSVFDKEGDLVTEVSDVEIAEELHLQNAEAYKTMKSLYEHARSKASNVTGALTDLMKTLDDI